MSDVVGYAASLAVLATFLMRSMVPLRLIAILSNLLFVSYGYLAHIHPVLVLHAVLLPINIARLVSHGEGYFPNQLCEAAAARIRHIWLFVLGLTVGSLGLRTLIHFVFAFFSQCRRSFV